MFDLELEPWIPGDMATLAAIENDQESKVNDMVDMFRGQTVPADEVTETMERLGIYYPWLPKWLKDRVDEIDVY